MLYVIIGREARDGLEQRKAGRERHLARIEALIGEGRLVLAGPLPAVDSPDPGPAGFAGSLIVAEFDSLQAARAWAEADPYRETGAWEATEVHPFKQVAP